MRSLAYALCPLILICLLGCSRPQPKHIVFVIDTSASIVPAAEQGAFRAVAEAIRSAKRADVISVIPILDNAEVDAEGRIARFHVPTARQAYDTDLRVFREHARVSMQDFENSALEHPALKTDILGSIRLAEQEFAADQSGTEQVLVILSDFIQDDGAIDFRQDPRFASSASATSFAQEWAKREKLHSNVRVFLGSLRSVDMAGVAENRKRAIGEFWQQYFVALGCHPTAAVDGPGLLEEFLDMTAE